MRALVHAAAAATLLVGAASAGAGAQSGPIVTESEFLAPLGTGHPAWLAAREGLGEAEATALRARALPDPVLSASREAPGDAEQIDLTLGWSLPHPARRRLAIRSADAAVQAARANLTVERHALLQAMREAFAQWATTTAAAARAAASAARLDELARREAERARAGESSGLSARRLALAATESRVELARAEAARVTTSAAARAWRPDLPPDSLPAMPSLPPPVPPTSSPHPRLAALQAELDAARLGERLAARVVEMPELVGGWQRQDSGGAMVAEGPIVGVAWSLPLLDRRRGDRTAARTRVESLEARLALAERELAATRAGAAATYGTLRAAALAASETAAEVPLVIDAASRSFTAGESELTDLLDTLRSAANAEIAALELHAEALAAHRRLAALDPVAADDVPEPAPNLHDTPATGDNR